MPNHPIEQPHYTDKHGDYIDPGKFFAAARFEQTIRKIHQKEIDLLKLSEKNPATFTNKDLIKVYQFCKRLFARSKLDLKNAQNPEMNIGTFSLKAKKPELEIQERKQAVNSAETLIHLLEHRLELLQQEVEKRYGNYTMSYAEYASATKETAEEITLEDKEETIN